MHRSLLFLGLVAASAAVCLGACGANDVAKVAAGSGPTSSSTGTTSGGGGATGTGGMCNAPPPPSPTLPEQLGCYVDPMGNGWVPVPCLCDLWLENTTPGPATARVELTVTPPDQVPALTGPLEVDVAFDDPDAGWYATWAKQAGNGVLFTVTSEGGTTTVTMGESGVVLGPVPLAACETRKAIAHVSGSSSATLSMHAILDDGTIVATTDGTCFNPPPP